MRLDPSFRVVNVSDEFLVIPTGEKSRSFDGIITINEPTAYILEKMEVTQSIDDLAILLTEKYDVDLDIATKDIVSIIKTLSEYGVINS